MLTRVTSQRRSWPTNWPTNWQGKLRRSRQWLTVLLLVFAAIGGLPTALFAHPLGNFTVNRYARLEPQGNEVTLLYIVDMAEIPAHQERTLIDSNGDGTLTAAEEQAYAERQVAMLQQKLHLTLNGTAIEWKVVDQSLTFPTGQAALPTLRLVVHYVATLEQGADQWQADFRDDNYADRIGWQEVIVRSTDGANVVESTVPTTDLSQELHSYPESLLQNPPQINQATFRFTPLAVTGTTPAASQSAQMVPATAATATLSRATDPFADLINVPTLGPVAILLALLAAFGWGAAHALSPGHGKTIVAAYLVGSRGTAYHALFLGLTTTITHTAGVFILGGITLFASQYILPETLFPWLSLLSGLVVVIIGITMAWRWIQGAGIGHHAHAHPHPHEHRHAEQTDHHHAHDEHTHAHDEEHSHDGQVYHRHGSGSWHTHTPPGADGEPVTWRSLLALGISGGLLPCPSALVVMLGAIALHRVAFGLVLIGAFSLGLASVLTAIGIMLVYAGRFFNRLPQGGRLLRLLPAASALFITVVGIGITFEALRTIGF